MKTFSLVRFAAAMALAVLSNAAWASPEAWERANDEYQAQRFANALAIYEEIASTGDAQAAELAGHMLAIGERLYGKAVRRNPARATKLLSQAVSAGRPVAAYLLRKSTFESAAAIKSE